MSKKQILDPLSSLCKLGMLTYYDKGSRIGINYNIICLQKPGNKQWFTRFLNGDNRDDISILYNPILKAIEWYILSDKESEENDEMKDAIRNIMSHAIKGLRTLQTTYQKSDDDNSGNVILAIKFLVTNLKMAQSDDLTRQKFLDFNEIEDTDDHLVNYDIIREIWNLATIKSISDQFRLCDKCKDKENLSCLLKALGSMLKGTEQKFQKLVQTMNTSL